jgi:hypothetical protein
VAASLPKRIDAIGIPCLHCKSKNTVVELYDETGPEGVCMSCSRTFLVSQEVLASLARNLPIYRRYIRVHNQRLAA